MTIRIKIGQEEAEAILASLPGGRDLYLEMAEEFIQLTEGDMPLTDLERQVIADMKRDNDDRDVEGLIVEDYWKRLPDGRWYAWLVGIQQWARSIASDNLEMAFQAGRKFEG